MRTRSIRIARPIPCRHRQIVPPYGTVSAASGAHVAWARTEVRVATGLRSRAMDIVRSSLRRLPAFAPMGFQLAVALTIIWYAF